MAIIIKAPAKYIQGKGELANIGQHAKKLGKKFFLLCSDNSEKRFGQTIKTSLEAAEKALNVCLFNGECTMDEIARVSDDCRNSGCDVVIGAGGGKVLDTAKAVADGLGLPMIIVPTVASNDAPCTSVAVVYNEKGVVVKAILTKNNPDLVLVDTEIIAKSPARLFAAGIGDAVATWFEARAVKNSNSRTMFRGYSSNTGMALCKLCYDILIEDGARAFNDVKSGQTTQAVENVVEASVYLSGVGFECGGLAAAHAINDSLVYLPQTKGMYHGEKVAFGTLAQLVLEKAPQQEFDEVMALLKSTGLPMTLADMGVTSYPSDEELLKVGEAACVPTQFTKNMPFPVTPQDVVEAIKQADKLGAAYK